MRGFTSLLACGLFAAAFSLSGCIGYYERVIDSPVLVPIPSSPPTVVVTQKREALKAVPTEQCSIVGGHRYCTPLEKKSEPEPQASEASAHPAMCATPGKWKWNGVQWVCTQPAPESRFVPSTFSYMTPMYPYGYPYGFGYPFMPFMGPIWGGALYGGPSVFYANPQQSQPQQSQLQQVLKQNQEILRRLEQK